MKRTGQVNSVSDRDFNSIKLWSFQLEGSNRYFRTGKVQPEIEVGQWITFEERNGVVDAETIEQAIAQDGAEASPETEPATSVSESKGETKKMSDPAIGKRMQYQAARRDASNIVIAALHTDHLPHPVNAAKGKRLDLLLQYVEEVTKTLLEREEEA